MPITVAEVVDCPNCKKSHDITVPKRVNVSMEPQYKKQIMDLSFFNWTCPDCNENIHLIFPFLYHDITRDLMIKLSPVETELDDDLDTDIVKGYRLRTAVNINELREKIRIFDHNLDDRAVEMLKVVIIGNFKKRQEDDPDSPMPDYIFFSQMVKDQMDFTLIKNGHEVQMRVNYAAYIDVVNRLMPKLSWDNSNCKFRIVDHKWAFDFLREIGELKIKTS